MKYEKPKCDCGGVLYFEQEHIYTRWYKILKNGETSDNWKLSLDCNQTALNDGLLGCRDCTNKYFVDYDNKNRIIRGELAN